MTDVERMLQEMQEVLSASAVGIEGGDTGLTADEWGEAWGISKGTARNRLKVLWKQGRIEVGRRMTRFMDGRLGMLPVYRPKP